MSVAELGARLRQARDERGESQQEVARNSGLSRNFIAQIERGESVPTVVTLARIAAALATTVADLLGEGNSGLVPGDADLVAVPLISDRIAAGPPLLVDDRVERRDPLPRSLLHSLGVEPRHAVLVRLGTGQDSMADTILPGATVLVDRAPVREIAARGIYAVREEAGGEGGATIKRLVLDAASRVLILLSDNPAHLPRAIRLRTGQPLAEHVVGRVVWWLPPTPRARR